jgi:uncharacterized protein (DUF2141 family)
MMLVDDIFKSDIYRRSIVAPRLISFILFALALTPLIAISSTLHVQVTNVSSEKGLIGCSLHVSGGEFPMGTAAFQQWLPAKKGDVLCIFENIQPGTDAVAVSHDVNKNGITDTNFLGIPKEAWGVSNNIRPIMRAPTFTEAQFQYPDLMNINIKIH